ncbi:MAG: S9 family peptidase [Acidimicrobiaceae bacterium]|nr:S9 family peptidase [Acidimicrobiaceae bacterium]
MDRTESFPRRQARTRRFTLGEPRDFRVSQDGSRVTFLRSSGPVDPVNSLWVLDVASGVERLVADPRLLGSDRDEQALPRAERARRERMRETASGIVSYDADEALTAAVFALEGRLWRVSLVEGGPPEPLAASPGAFDPRLSPDGVLVAYVAGTGLRVTGDADGDRAVATEPGETVTWGAAEFVAAEEMGRTRGHWWSPDSRRLLAARVDTSLVPSWWIADPASPDAEPVGVRYPAAGASNAEVGLALFDVDGDARVDVAWDEGGWEYLAGVRWSADGLLLTVQTRDQRTLGVLQADPDTGTCRLLSRITDTAWVDLVPGVPRLAGSRLVTVEDRGAAKRLCVDGEALTPDDMQVRAVHHADEAGVVVTASVDPAEVHAARVGWDGTVERLTSGPGVHGVAMSGDTAVHISRSMDRPGRRCAVRSARRKGPDLLIQSHAAEPGLELNVEILELGPRRLVSALVLPAGQVRDGDAPLPVLLDPYGGPHAQRVQRAEALFHTSQWFADQGFAVLVADGRGTPGRGPDFERTVRGDLAGPVLDDQIDALEAAARLNPRLDLTRTAIRGWSFGGYLAALAVLRRPDVFSAAIAGAPVTDWRLYDTHYTERYLGHPAEEPGNYERTDLTPLASGLKRPLMLVHGLADDNVVAAHTLRLSQALTEAGRPHTVLPLSGVTHMTPQEEVAENLLLIQLRFLQDALGMPVLAPREQPPRDNEGAAGE